MLTARAWWFLLSVLLVLAAGLLKPALPLTLIGLTLLLWFISQWLLFLLRLPSVREVRVEREVWDDKSAVATLWAGQTFEVRVRLIAPEWLASPHIAADDRVPYAVEHLDGTAAVQGVLGWAQPLEFRYRIRCGPAGLARFEGVRVQAADWQGFFYHVHFVHAVVVLRVLPVLARRAGQPAAKKKRHNALMPPGVHRFRRPGSGSELLDLRDYLPGDPPKTIAWKLSARRDRLITKEFESEVPVRCTLFVDTSNSVRLPGLAGVGARQVNYGKALDRLVDLAAGVLQAGASIRDLTGLCLFDERGVTTIRPGRGDAHRTECLRKLSAAAALMPRLERINPDHLLPLGYSFAREVYPELLRPALNSMPFWATWMDGFSGYSRRLPLGLSELLPRWKSVWTRLNLFELLHRRKNELQTLCWWSSFWSLLLPLLILAAKVFLKARISEDVLVFTLFYGPLLSLLLWGGSSLLFAFDTMVGSAKRRRDRWRKQLAAILSVRYVLGAGGLATLLEDDDAFSLLLQRFLNEHQVPYTLPLYGADGRYLFAAPQKVPVLADALLRAVGKGRDNELFVLLADLLELDDGLDPLLRAVRVALGRHHQVVLICPWQPGLALPHDNPAREAAASLAVHGRPSGPRRKQTSSLHSALWDQATTRRFHLAYQRLRRTFTRLGVSVLCAASDEPVPLILSRLERLRAPGRPHP
jgi:uncharacterized protein (DUF58 family)